MKTHVLATTHDPSDCASVGWSIEWHGGRLMAERRCLRKGLIDGIRILLGRRMPLDVAKLEASFLDGDKLENIRHRLEAGHSVTAVWPRGAGQAKVTSYGHAVQ